MTALQRACCCDHTRNCLRGGANIASPLERMKAFISMSLIKQTPIKIHLIISLMMKQDINKDWTIFLSFSDGDTPLSLMDKLRII